MSREGQLSVARDDVHHLGVLFARRASPFLASPGSAGGGLSRARVVSRERVLFLVVFDEITVPIPSVYYLYYY